MTGDQNVSVKLIITIHISGAQRLFDHPVLKRDRQNADENDIKEFSRNGDYSGKSISITYSECVSVEPRLNHAACKAHASYLWPLWLYHIYHIIS